VQELELREVAQHAGWQVVEVYTDHGISGAKGRKNRPALDRLLKDGARRRFDLVAVPPPLIGSGGPCPLCSASSATFTPSPSC